MTREQLDDLLDEAMLLGSGEVVEQHKYGWSVLLTRRGLSGTCMLKLGKMMDFCGIELKLNPITRTECINLIFNN